MKYCFMRFPEGKFKAVTYSYDDGCRHDLRFLETIDRYGIKCTFNICSGKIGETDGIGNLTVNEIRKHILDKGHEVAIHGERHIAPVLSRPVTAIQDVLNCRLGLEKAFGQIIRGMAYADVRLQNYQNGASFEVIREYLKDLGIVYARNVGSDGCNFRLPDDWYTWNATVHHANPQAVEYAETFMAIDEKSLYCASRWPKLFMLWGHSFEFNKNNNWELLDSLCQVLGGHEDVWYATCIDIYEYAHAYESLVFSADSTRVYNPTLIKLWFDVDGKLYSIEPGETLIIE